MKKIFFLLLLLVCCFTFFGSPFFTSSRFLAHADSAPVSSYKIDDLQSVDFTKFSQNLVNQYQLNNLTYNFTLSIAPSSGHGEDVRIAHIDSSARGDFYRYYFYNLASSGALSDYQYRIYVSGNGSNGYDVFLNKTIYQTWYNVKAYDFSNLIFHIVPDEFFGYFDLTTYTLYNYLNAYVIIEINWGDITGYYSQFNLFSYTMLFGDEEPVNTYSNQKGVEFHTNNGTNFNDSFTNNNVSDYFLLNNNFNAQYEYISAFFLQNAMYLRPAYVGSGSGAQNAGLNLFLRDFTFGNYLSVDVESVVNSTFGAGQHFYRSAEWYEVGTHLYNLIIYLIFDAPLISDILSLFVSLTNLFVTCLSLVFSWLTSSNSTFAYIFFGFLVLSFVLKRIIKS